MKIAGREKCPPCADSVVGRALKFVEERPKKAVLHSKNLPRHRSVVAKAERFSAEVDFEKGNSRQKETAAVRLST